MIDLANVLIFSLDCINLVCKQFFDEANFDLDELKLVRESGEVTVCNFMLPSLGCYYKFTPFYWMVYALPVIFMVAFHRPHDCFYCLNKNPRTRISNFQVTLEQ